MAGKSRRAVVVAALLFVAGTGCDSSSGDHSNFEIFVFGLNGTSTNITRNKATDADPAWAPDGSTIAFVRTEAEDRREIVLVDAGGGSSETLTKEGDNEDPAWSPDSRKIAFVRVVHTADGGSQGQIYVV